MRLSPRQAEKIILSEGATCREALAAMMQSATQQIFANRPVVLETDDPEGARARLRIGLRRLRSALGSFRPLLDASGVAGHGCACARPRANAVSELRDADVFIEDMYGQAAGVMVGHPGLHPLKDHRLQKRDAARVALQGKDWSALQLYLRALAAQPSRKSKISTGRWPSSQAKRLPLQSKNSRQEGRAHRQPRRRGAPQDAQAAEKTSRRDR